jgi:predicted RNA-binding protein YlxR (DUF448 family)
LTRNKPVPLRSCASCGQKLAKRELTRIVRGLDGRVEADPTGRKSGRGAYLCADPGCWKLGLGRGRVERALRSAITEEEKAALLQYHQEQLKPTGIGDVR